MPRELLPPEAARRKFAARIGRRAEGLANDKEGHCAMNRFLSCVLGSALLGPAAFAAGPAVPTTPATPSTPGTAPATTAPADPAAGIREVETAVRAWAAAWSARDVTRYLAAYASDFTPPRGQDRKAWEADRRARIEEKAAISVEIDSLVISLKGQAATASFQQTYSADKLREKSRKTLELQRVEGRWLIRKEGAGG